MSDFNKGGLVQFSFGDGYAGSAKIAIISSELMMKRGWDVTLFVSEGSLTQKRAEEKGIKTVALNSRLKFNDLFKLIDAAFLRLNARYVVTYHSLDRKVGIKLKRRYGSRIINFAYRQNISMSAPVIGALLYNLYYDYQIACSGGVAESLIKSGMKRRKVKIIHNGIQVPADLGSISGAEVRSALPFEDKIILGLSTWFHKERKGFDILFKAFSGLDQRYALLIVGIPEETRAEVLEYAGTFGIEPTRIYMPGYVDNIWEYYKAMDIFLLPSRSEGFSLALMEAAAAGIPAVASDIPGTNEFIKDGENGFLFNINDPEELAGKINILAADADLRARFSRAARELVMNNYLIHHLADRMEALFTEAAGHSLPE